MKRPVSQLEEALLRFESDVQAKADAKPSDELFERIQAMVGGSGGQKVAPPKVQLSEEIKTAVYLNVIDIVKSGASPKQVAASVLQLLEDTINNANNQGSVESNEVSSSSKPAFNGAFRRSE